MVVQVTPRIRHGNKAMEGREQKVEANILLLGAENVGKSGKFFLFFNWDVYYIIIFQSS